MCIWISFVIFLKLNTDCQWFFLIFPVAIFFLQEMNWDTTCITFSCLCCTGKQKHSCSTWLCTLLGVWITVWVWKLKASQANVSEVWIETAKSLVVVHFLAELKNALTIGHFRVHLSLHFKARPSAKSLLWKSVFHSFSSWN